MIVELHPESPLAKAGLKRGDVILAHRGQARRELAGTRLPGGTTPIGDSHALLNTCAVARRVETQVTMVAAPETVDRATTLIEGKNPLAGMVAANLSPAVAEELRLPSRREGRGGGEDRQWPGPAFRAAG